MTKFDKCWNGVMDNLFIIEKVLSEQYVAIKWSIKGPWLGMSNEEAITKGVHECKEKNIKILKKYCKLIRL